jgi:hypothetical protein
LDVPAVVQRLANLRPGDKFEFRALGGLLTITAKSPSTGKESNPALRRLIDICLISARGTQNYGPYTANEAATFLKTELKSRGKRRVWNP